MKDQAYVEVFFGFLAVVGLAFYWLGTRKSMVAKVFRALCSGILVFCWMGPLLGVELLWLSILFAVGNFVAELPFWENRVRGEKSTVEPG